MGGDGLARFLATATDWRDPSTYVQEHEEIISVDLGTAGRSFRDGCTPGRSEGNLHAVFHHMYGEGTTKPSGGSTPTAATPSPATAASGPTAARRVGDAEHPRKTAVAFDDGTNFTFTRLERPHLIFDAKGAPTHLVNAAQYGGGKDPGTTGDNGDASYTLVRPILQQGNKEMLAMLTAATPRSCVLALTRRVADSFVRREDPSSRARCGWEEAALMQGLVATSAATGNATYAALAKAWSEAHRWTVCKADVILTERDAANDMSCGQIYAELYLLDRNATYLSSIHTTLDALARRPQTDDWWWVDAYFMALPAFARLGNITADDALHDKGLALYRDSAIRRGLWSAEDGLYYRDESYFNATTPAGAPVFWARGNAWAIGAMARSHAFTPPTHPAHAVYSTSSGRARRRARAAPGRRRHVARLAARPAEPAERRGDGHRRLRLRHRVRRQRRTARRGDLPAHRGGGVARPGDARPRFRLPRPLPAGGRPPGAGGAGRHLVVLRRPLPPRGERGREARVTLVSEQNFIAVVRQRCDSTSRPTSADGRLIRLSTGRSQPDTLPAASQAAPSASHSVNGVPSTSPPVVEYSAGTMRVPASARTTATSVGGARSGMHSPPTISGLQRGRPNGFTDRILPVAASRSHMICTLSRAPSGGRR